MGAITQGELVRFHELDTAEQEGLLRTSYLEVIRRLREGLSTTSSHMSVPTDAKTIIQGTELELSLLLKNRSHYQLVCEAQEIIHRFNLIGGDKARPELVAQVVEITDHPPFESTTSLADQERRSRRQLEQLQRIFSSVVPQGIVLGNGFLPLYGLEERLVDRSGNPLSRAESVFPQQRYQELYQFMNGKLEEPLTIPCADGKKLSLQPDIWWEGGTQALNVTYSVPGELYGYFCDALKLIEPIVEALTANSPLFAGYLTRNDVIRRHVFGTITDDRTRTEKKAGKYSRLTVPFWVMNDALSPNLAHLRPSLHMEAYASARDAGLPEGYARLVGLMHGHAPLILERSLLDAGADQYGELRRLVELISGTQYTTFRAKPQFFTSGILAVEERIPSAQLTAFEKTATSAFITYAALSLARLGLAGNFPYVACRSVEQNLEKSCSEHATRWSYVWKTNTGERKIPFSSIVEELLAGAADEAIRRGQSPEDVERYFRHIAQQANCALKLPGKKVQYETLTHRTEAEWTRVFVCERNPHVQHNARVPDGILDELLDHYCAAQQENEPLVYRELER